MKIEIDKVDEDRLREMVVSGRYPTTKDALHEAVLLLDEHDRKVAWLRSAIDAGRRDFENGNFEEWSPELMARLIEESDQSMSTQSSERHAAKA